MVKETSDLALPGVDRGEVLTELDENVDSVLIDKVQVQQVLLNLIRNAFEAMENSKHRDLRIVSAAGDSETVEVSVIDTGPGIAENVAAQLFQPFVTTKHHGMGVGLSISKTIIESHGGRIWVEPIQPEELFQVHPPACVFFSLSRAIPNSSNKFSRLIRNRFALVPKSDQKNSNAKAICLPTLDGSLRGREMIGGAGNMLWGRSMSSPLLFSTNSLYCIAPDTATTSPHLGTWHRKSTTKRSLIHSGSQSSSWSLLTE